MRNLIDKLEVIYEGLDKKKILMIYVAVAIVFAAIFATTLSLPIINKQKELQDQLNEVNSKISQLKVKQFQNKKASLQQEKLQLNSTYSENRDAFVSALSTYNSYSFIKFSNESMTKFLDSVMKDSLQHSLTIKSVENKLLEDDALYRYSITVTGTGSYLNIIRYFEQLLAYEAILSLKQFEVFINKDKNLEFNLLFHFGGE